MADDKNKKKENREEEGGKEDEEEEEEERGRECLPEDAKCEHCGETGLCYEVTIGGVVCETCGMVNSQSTVQLEVEVEKQGGREIRTGRLVHSDNQHSLSSTALIRPKSSNYFGSSRHGRTHQKVFLIAPIQRAGVRESERKEILTEYVLVVDVLPEKSTGSAGSPLGTTRFVGGDQRGSLSVGESLHQRQVWSWSLDGTCGCQLCVRCVPSQPQAPDAA